MFWHRARAAMLIIYIHLLRCSFNHVSSDRNFGFWFTRIQDWGHILGLHCQEEGFLLWWSEKIVWETWEWPWMNTSFAILWHWSNHSQQDGHLAISSIKLLMFFNFQELPIAHKGFNWILLPLRQDLLFPATHWSVQKECMRRNQQRVINSKKLLGLKMAYCKQILWRTL